MQVSSADMAKIICEAQGDCVHRSDGRMFGRCGDCSIAAELIWALVNDRAFGDEEFSDSATARKLRAAQELTDLGQEMGLD